MEGIFVINDFNYQVKANLKAFLIMIKVKSFFMLLSYIGFSLLSPDLVAQAVDSAMLCQGAYYTEAEGRTSLEKFAATFHDQKSWEKRGQRIREGIVEGMDLQ